MITSVLSISGSLFVVAGEKLVLEEDEVEGADCHAAVCKVEDRCKEDEMTAAYEWHPVRPVGVYQWEIEHVNYFAEEEGSISHSAQLCYGSVGGFTEDEAIEEAVHNVAQCSCCDKGEADYNTCRSIRFFQKTGNPYDQDGEQDDSEDGKAQFAEHSAEFHAECHTLVLYEEDAEPVADDVEATADRKVYFDKNLDNLVDNDECNSQDYQPSALRDMFHQHYLFLFIISLASMVRVA